MATHDTTNISRRAAIAALAGTPAFVGTFAIAIATPAAANEGGEWDRALADYQAKRAASDTMPLGTPNEDDAVDAYCEAMDYLINEVPAPDIAAVRVKLELAFARCADFGFSEDYQEAILADLRRLGREG